MAVTELYEIQIHRDLWRFTSAQRDTRYQGELYQNVPISRDSAIEQSSDPLKCETSFSVRSGNKLAELALNPPLNVAPKVTIKRTENGQNYLTVFSGRLVAGKWDDGWVTVELEPVHTELQVTGLNETIPPLCRYSLGSRKCGRVLYPTQVNVMTVVGDVVTIDRALPSNYRFGRLEEGYNHYFIESQLSGTQFRLLHIPGFKPGAKVSLVEGCDRTIYTCVERFQNGPNFGGALNLPTKNPYVGDPIDR
ncbi:phage BR0599 family protein [Enterovibrio nigricans]|uniref:Uncharacterized conserved protein n=1 Tax=Enterovibrio nigricans DSM 22720 TaxID=1121868 RepID=A0A1T4V437_9GAMM|nr:phage BR0599 family protein [Enterovibrio nigricans]PKF48852.1 hypothetical protein AT251_23105 [Enterovibrio nigricans]SKA59696.1 Uncharacterized conserved protein [Enterovibrio nigricans DSM 22720]